MTDQTHLPTRLAALVAFLPQFEAPGNGSLGRLIYNLRRS